MSAAAAIATSVAWRPSLCERRLGPIARFQRYTSAGRWVHTSLHWVEVLDTAGIPCGPINTIDQVFADPQVRHLGLVTPMLRPRLGPQGSVRARARDARIGERRQVWIGS
nr:CoA transferase [Roseomonas sp. SXEYE001]